MAFLGEGRCEDALTNIATSLRDRNDLVVSDFRDEATAFARMMKLPMGRQGSSRMEILAADDAVRTNSRRHLAEQPSTVTAHVNNDWPTEGNSQIFPT